MGIFAMRSTPRPMQTTTQTTRKMHIPWLVATDAGGRANVLKILRIMNSVDTNLLPFGTC